jgi:hypothetical protein
MKQSSYGLLPVPGKGGTTFSSNNPKGKPTFERLKERRQR